MTSTPTLARLRAFVERRPEFRILLAFLALVLVVLVFGKAAAEVMEGDALAADRAILLALRSPGDPGPPVGPAWLRQAMTDVTALGGFTVLTVITVLAAGYLLAARRPRTALFLAGSAALGALLNTGLKALYARSRPDLVAHLVGTHSASFPSGHAMNSATVFLILAVIIARTQSSRAVRIYLVAAAIVLTLTVGFSRVYLGVHWPTDVAAGWAVGGTWAVLCALAARWVQPRVPDRG
jgi:undecaprenyl-diphosphatase